MNETRIDDRGPTGPPPQSDFAARSLRLETLIRLRWLAVAGQSVAVAAVYFGLGFPLPLVWCIGLIALSAALNIGLGVIFPASLRLGARPALLLLSYDALQLGALLFVTGGLGNPFAILLLVPVIVSATTLAPRPTMLLGALVVVVATVLAFAHLPLPWHPGETLSLPWIYTVGVWVALVSTCAFTGTYAFRVAEEARQLARALNATEMVLAREQHLSALDGLAAAAAHELGTPLATIALVARELEREMAPDDPRGEDITLPGERTREPTFGLPALWITPQDKERAQMDGYTVVDGAAVIATHLTEIIRASGHEILGRQEVQNLLDNLAKMYPKVVDDLIPTQLSLGAVVRILRNLLRERVSIRDLRTILESVADYTIQTKDPDLLTEYARQNLSRTITNQYATPEGLLHVISLEPMLDRRLAEAVNPAQGSLPNISPSFMNQFVESLKKAIEKTVGQGYQPIVLCSQTVRSYVYKLISPGLQTLAVLSPNEIDGKAKIQAIEVVRLPHEAETV